jgi:trimeric autotransporter adhesin
VAMKRSTFFLMRRMLSVLLALALVLPAGTAFAAQSTTPAVADVTVSNNVAGIPDTVQVDNLTASGTDVVRVYNTLTATTPIGTGIQNPASTTVTIAINQLGVAAGNVYVSRQASGETESARATKAYLAEPVTAIPPAVGAVTNNVAPKTDSIVVNGNEGDVFRVYATAAGTTPLGTITLPTGTTSATLELPQLGTASGTVHLSRTQTLPSHALESPKLAVAFGPEAVSTSPTVNTPVNNHVTDVDSITVTNTTAGDIVRVYKTAATTDVSPVGSAVATGASTTVELAELGMVSGTVYVTLLQADKLESPRVAATFSPPPVTTAPSGVTISNNWPTATDKITVPNLNPGDVARAYKLQADTTPFGVATVPTSAAPGTAAVIEIYELGKVTGTVYVSVTSPNMRESSKVAATYAGIATTPAPTTGQVSVQVGVPDNGAASTDKVTVSGLQQGDIVRIYKTATDLNPLGTATVPASQTSATVEIYQLGKTATAIHISVTRTDGTVLLESTRLAYTVVAEQQTPAPTGTATNNAAPTPDAILVSGVAAGDLVKVYSSATATTPVAATEATGSPVTVTVAQLGKTAGTAYISSTTPGLLESNKVAVTYGVEAVTTAPVAANITVVNNPVRTADTITVTGLTAGDVVKVYSAATAGTLLGAATVAPAQTSVTIEVYQLGTTAGNVYVSATTPGLLESSRTGKAYTA